MRVAGVALCLISLLWPAPLRADPGGVSLAFFNCGTTPVRISWLEPERIILQRGEQMIALAQIPFPKESGVRFQTIEGEEPQFIFWVNGSVAHIMPAPTGEKVPSETCARADVPEHGDVPYYRAFGHNPDWNIVFSPGLLTVTAESEPDSLVFSRPPAEEGPRERTYTGQHFDITVTNDLCTDPTTRLFYPEQVSFSWSGRKLHGCGEILTAPPQTPSAP